MVEEVAEDLREEGLGAPSAVVTCVGGGGLLCGILEGMHRVGWRHVPVVAMETRGAASFRAAWHSGQPVTIADITSVAITLGAKKVCQRVVDYIREHPLISELVSDRVAVQACFQFADDHRMLVEPSCGAALSAIYSGLASRLYHEGRLEASPRRPLVAVVCGGSAATLPQLEDWKRVADGKDEPE
uniref:L-serine ammonia-lyase n=1 Tax=Amblyomma aureolatum TaxID=187763 RepID=A0A1E1WWY8_9ACAR